MPGFHLYQRGSTWWTNFSVAGGAFRLSTGERDRRAAEEKAATLYLEEHRRQRVAVPEADAGGLELTKVCALYLADLEERIASGALQRGPRYYDNEESALAHVLLKFRTAEAINTKSWRRAREVLRGEGVGSRTLQRITVAARHLLTFACELGAIQSEPNIKAPLGEDVAKEQAERRPMTVREREGFLRAVRAVDRRAWRIYLVLFWTGLRKSELERLRVRDVDLRGGWINLQPRRTKSGKKGQEVDLHPRARAAIREELRTRKVIDPSEPIFGPFDYDRLFWQVVAQLELDAHGLTAHHVARHSLATQVGERGATLAELLATFRWATPQMAMRYMKVNARLSRAALRRLP